MRTITGLVLIIFGGNIMRIDCQEENMLDLTLEFINIVYFEENRFFDRTGDNSIAWKEDSDDKIYAFVGIEATNDIHQLGNICQESRWGPKIDEYRDKIVTFFYAQNKPCPIKKGTTSNLENLVLKTQREQGDLMCGNEIGELLLVDIAPDRQVIISTTLNITTSGCQ